MRLGIYIMKECTIFSVGGKLVIWYDLSWSRYQQEYQRSWQGRWFMLADWQQDTHHFPRAAVDYLLHWRRLSSKKTPNLCNSTLYAQLSSRTQLLLLLLCRCCWWTFLFSLTLGELLFAAAPFMWRDMIWFNFSFLLQRSRAQQNDIEVKRSFVISRSFFKTWIRWAVKSFPSSYLFQLLISLLLQHCTVWVYTKPPERAAKFLINSSLQWLQKALKISSQFLSASEAEFDLREVWEALLSMRRMDGKVDVKCSEQSRKDRLE